MGGLEACSTVALPLLSRANSCRTRGVECCASAARIPTTSCSQTSDRLRAPWRRFIVLREGAAFDWPRCSRRLKGNSWKFGAGWLVRCLQRKHAQAQRLSGSSAEAKEAIIARASQVTREV